jgi:hypothetical protein
MLIFIYWCKDRLHSASVILSKQYLSWYHHLKPRLPKTDIYNQSGIYQLKCNDCSLKYIGQTGRTFKTRYKEHIYAIRTNKLNSKYAEHILDTGHTYGTINETVDVMRIKKEGRLLNIHWKGTTSTTSANNNYT